MAEIATIARPYAEALYKAASSTDAASWVPQMQALAQVAQNEQLRQFADHPKAVASQVLDLLTSAAGVPLADGVKNLLGLLVENGRLSALPEIASQFQSLVNAATGISEAVIHSAFEIAPAQLADVVAVLEKRFGRKLAAKVELEPDLIGGIRVVVGDEVLDTSVKARLERMKVALTA
jgi:F-type H+-transporting ATPase subunit delta